MINLNVEGTYDANKRYIVKNWSDSDFTQEFGPKTVYNDNKIIEEKPAYTLTLKSGELRELGQFEAFTIVKHFITREIYKEAAKLTGAEKNNLEMGVHNAAFRQPYIERTISEITDGETNTFVEKLREEIRAEESAKLKSEKKEKTDKKEEKEVKKETKNSEFAE